MRHVNFDWYGHRGIQIRTFWQLAISIVVLWAAVGTINAQNDVDNLLARQAEDDKARAAAVEQGEKARKQQCALTPVFVKALDIDRLTSKEERLFNMAVKRNLKGCP